MESLEKSLNDFFTYFLSFIKEWSLCIDKSKDIFKGLKNLSEQLECTDSCSWDQILKRFPDVKRRLVHKIDSSLEAESSQLNETWSSLSILCNTLEKKMDLIERNASKQSLACFSSRGLIVPPVYKLIEYAEDVVRYYKALFIQMTSALNSMDYKKQETTLNLEKIFLNSSKVSDEIKDVLSSVKHFIDIPFSIEKLCEAS